MDLRSPKGASIISHNQKFRCKNEIYNRVNKSTKEFLPDISPTWTTSKSSNATRPREHIRAMMAMVMTKMLSNVPSAQAMRQMPPSKKLPNWARFRPTIFSIFQLPTNLLLWTNKKVAKEQRPSFIGLHFTSFPLRKVGVLCFFLFFIFKAQISSRFFIPAPIWLARLAKRHARTSDPLISMELRYALEHKESAE